MGKNSPFSVGILRFANQVLLVVKQSALRLPTRALLLWGKLSRDQLLQKAYFRSVLAMFKAEKALGPNFPWCFAGVKQQIRHVLLALSFKTSNSFH